MAVTGSLISFMEGKSFGFIKRDDGQGDVFVHVRQLRNGGEPDMVIGTKFSFDVEPDEKSGKTKAVNVSITQPGAAGGMPGGGGGFMGGGGGGFMGGAPAPMGGAGGGRDKCGDFLAGRCTRGDRCKYSHDDGSGGFGAVGGGQPDPRYSPYGMPAPMQYGAPMGMPGLLPGWEMITDPASGRPYYCNRATGQSAWEPPVAAAAPPPMAPQGPQLPMGWEQVSDPASGKPYYCNRATGQSSWEIPRA